MGARELKSYTYEEYLSIDAATPEEERHELIFGEIYMMSGASARHQDLVLNIAVKLKELIKEGCKPRVAPFDLKLSCEGSVNVVQPDVMLYCQDNELPCAVFEVLSPSTASKDKTVKKELYEFCGIKEYFIVSPEYKTVDAFVFKDGKYILKSYGEEDTLPIKCLEEEIKMVELFEGIDTL